MVGEKFIQWNYSPDHAARPVRLYLRYSRRVLFAKFMNLFLKESQPDDRAAGISAFPMSARVVQRMAKAEDPTNFILMPAISANVAGQLGSIVAGGLMIQLVSMLIAR